MKLRNLLMLPLVIAAFTFSACGNDDDDKATITNVPSTIVDAFKTQFPDVNINTVKFEKSGQYYTAEYHANNNMIEIESWFSTDGQWKMTETDYGKDLFLIPTDINIAFNKTEYRDWTIDDISLYEYPDATKNFYMIQVEKAGQPDTALYFKTDGTLIKTAADTGADITPDTVI